MILWELIPVGIYEEPPSDFSLSFLSYEGFKYKNSLKCIPNCQNNERRTRGKKIRPSYHMLPQCSLHLLTAQFVIIS
jgi:hypothetical protein